MPIRVVHCDDSRAFTRLVQLWLEFHPDIEHVGAAHDVEDALELIGEAQPDVVLLDTLQWHGENLPVARVREVAPGTSVVVYSGLPERLLARQLEGGDAYLGKADDEQELVATLRRLAGDAADQPGAGER